MLQEIQQALYNSLIGDNAKLKESNERLSELGRIQGYCTNLMLVINDVNLKSDIKQAALIQLKNNIKAKWKPKNQKIELTPAEKASIRDSLISAIILCAKQHKLIKLYREVLTTVIGYEYQSWIPLNQIVSNLSSGNNLVAIFHCIIAICTNFEFTVIDKEKIIYNIFLKDIFPLILKTVMTNPSDQLVYLALKIMWKVVHYDIPMQVKILTNDWMGLVYNTIQLVNPEMQHKLDEYQIKNTPQFFYYHSKKWATRILMRYVQKHAKALAFGVINKDNVQYSKLWYETYGIKLCDVVFRHLQEGIPCTKKIRYSQLKILQGIVNDRPDLILSCAHLFQYQVLIRYMEVTKQDNEMATNDVVEYLRGDDESSMTSSNIKRLAIEVWNSFLQLQSKLDRDKNIYVPGPLFESNLNFMFQKIKSNNLWEKQMGMSLFCENRISINRVPVVKQQMPIIIDTYVVPLLVDPNILIRAKANDMLAEYGKEIHDIQIMGRCLQGVYNCLVNDTSSLVKIKAAIALNSLVWHPSAKNFIKDYLKTILTVYLHLIEKYDLEQVVSALEYFIADFSENIGPFAIDLFKYLLKFFSSMFKKDIELSRNEDYDNEVQLAASGCIKAMTQIMESPLENQVRVQLEPLILELCAFLFSNESYDYHEDMFFLLRTHLQKIDKISMHCWFFYQVLIYFIVGIPNQQWKQIEASPMPEMSKNILASVREGNNFQFLEFAVPILRNFLGKGYETILAQKDDFKMNIVHLILHLVIVVYRKGVNTQIEGQLHFDYSSIMLVYVFETFPPEMTKTIVSPAWNICKFNITKCKTKYIKQITSQLISVILWKHGAQFLQLLANDNNFGTFMKYMTKISRTLEEYQQRKRVILGICSYLLLVQNQQILIKNVPELVKTLFSLVKKNCINRIICNTKNGDLKKQLLEIDDESEHEEITNNEEEDDDYQIWDQEYADKHCSLLKTINQLVGFRETMQKLNTDNPGLCQIVVGSLVPAKLQMVENLIEQAINLPEK